MFMCCCEKSRDENPILGPSERFGMQNRVFIAFLTEESHLGLRDVNVLTLVNEVLTASSKNAIVTAELLKIYE